MTVSAFDPFVPAETIEVDGVTPFDSAEALYSSCDYISLHIPANDKTKKSINYALLSKMKKGAALINTARKEVIDEADLVKIMTERSDLHYGTDVMPACDAELNASAAERYFSTAKKMGAQTAEANINAGIAAARQIVSFFENGDVTFKVN
jgi:D-3-phosphoglycerate dehydrogenase